MKLNLLPKHVVKSQGSRAAFFLMLVIIGACAAATYLMIKSGQETLAESKEPIDGLRAQVAIAMGNSALADTIVAEVTNIDRNLKLTEAMLKHNTVYVDLYNDVMKYIPSYYRITTISAVPTGADSCAVNMSGVIQTSEQYADLLAALYRMPGVSGVTRGGYGYIDPYVPPLNESDQLGTPVRPDEGNLPSNPEARMAELIRRANRQEGFFNINNFGTAVALKGPMPDWSTVTVTMTLTGKAILAPDTRATLLGGGAAAGRGAAGGGQPIGGRGGAAAD